jgi:hypothetical protein
VHLEGVLPKSISASDVGQTFLSAGSGDFPVPGFRVKLSALVREVGKLRNRQARKPALQFGQHALDTTTGTPDLSGSNTRRLHTCRMNPAFHADAASCIGGTVRVRPA